MHRHKRKHAGALCNKTALSCVRFAPIQAGWGQDYRQDYQHTEHVSISSCRLNFLHC